MTDDNFHNLALNESFERVAKVAKERDAFNEQMALREVLMAVTQDDRNAAASLYLKTEGEPYSLHDKATAAEIEMGVHDDWDCVQAFAAHRHLVLSDPAQNNAGGLWYRRWFQAMTLNDALEARGLEIREKAHD